MDNSNRYLADIEVQRRYYSGLYHDLERDYLKPILGIPGPIHSIDMAQQVQLVSNNRSFLTDDQRITASKKLSKAMDHRRIIRDLYPSNTPEQAGHQVCIDQREEIIKLLDLPRNPASIAQAARIVRNTDRLKQSDALADIRGFLASLQSCYDMVKKLWDIALDRRVEYSVAMIACGCMCNTFSSMINTEQARHPDWFDHRGLIQGEYLQKLTETSGLAQEITDWIPGMVNRNHHIRWAMLSRFFTTNDPQLSHDGPYDNLFSMVYREPWPLSLVFRDIFPGIRSAQGGEELNPMMNTNITQGLVWMMMDKIMSILDYQKIDNVQLDDAQVLIRRLERRTERMRVMFRRPRTMLGLSKSMTKMQNVLQDFRPGTIFGAYWAVASIRTWTEMTIHQIDDRFLMISHMVAMAHLFEYNRLTGITTPWISGVEKFRQLNEQYCDFFFKRGVRPQNMNDWKESAKWFYDLRKDHNRKALNEVCGERCVRRRDRGFGFATMQNDYRVDSSLIGASPPAEAWWKGLLSRIQKDVHRPGYASYILNRRGRRFFDDEPRFDVFKGTDECFSALNPTEVWDFLNELTSTNYEQARRRINKRLKKYPLNGSWLDPVQLPPG
ncbi:hypothetical protein F5Y15DRAFT_412440 [Xylariaceae sp. FL0016]|nr:hypothetical protein F5Y15DRAFT_412440 [Xylariaceae sp. FL0016]